MHSNKKAVAFFMSKIFNPAMMQLVKQTNRIAGYDCPDTTNATILRRATANALEAMYHLTLCLLPVSWAEHHGWAPRDFQWEEAKGCLRFSIRRLKEIRLCL